MTKSSKEARGEIEKIIPNAKLAGEISHKPSVVPVSAQQAFIHRCGSRLAFEEFCSMDHGFIDKIGRDGFAGDQW